LTILITVGDTMKNYSVCAGYLVPHPPVIVPEVGRGRESEAKSTITSMKTLAADVAALKPDTVVLISPHAPVFSDYVFMYDAPLLEGDLVQFGARASVSFEQDGVLRSRIERAMAEAGIPGGPLSTEDKQRRGIADALDHGAVVPLYYLGSEYNDFELVALSSSALDIQSLYLLGKVIRQSAEAEGRRIAVVASGDLSHKVNRESPYGASPEGAEFDRRLIGALAANDTAQVLSIDHRLREKAAECGYRSLVILCGAFDGLDTQIQVLSYEAPFGIGYGVATFKPVGVSGESALDKARSAMKSGNESPHVRLARKTLEEYVTKGEEPAPNDIREYEAAGELSGRAGVFVSIKKFGELRGCIGTTEPTKSSIAEEIAQNAISAGTRDPRFPPVTPDEFPYLDYSVDVLGEPEPVSSADELDPSVYGVIVEKDYRRGLLLPDLEGVDTVKMQLSIACRKAGIDPIEEYAISRFTVKRYR